MSLLAPARLISLTCLPRPAANCGLSATKSCECWDRCGKYLCPTDHAGVKSCESEQSLTWLHSREDMRGQPMCWRSPHTQMPSICRTQTGIHRRHGHATSGRACLRMIRPVAFGCTQGCFGCPGMPADASCPSVWCSCPRGSRPSAPQFSRIPEEDEQGVKFVEWGDRSKAVPRQCVAAAGLGLMAGLLMCAMDRCRPMLSPLPTLTLRCPPAAATPGAAGRR